MKRDWYLKGVLTAIAAGLWVLILRPVLLPLPTQAAQREQAVAKVVRASRFELVEPGGKSRASLSLLEGVYPSLRLRDRNGKIRIELSLEAEGGTRFSMLDGTGPPGYGATRLDMHVGQHAGPSIALFPAPAPFPSDSAAEDVMEWWISQQPRAYFGLLADGRPALNLLDAERKTRAVLGAADLETTRTGTVEKRPESSLVLFDKDGKVIWQAPP